MLRIRIIGLAILAVFAIGAVMSSSASAQVWEECSQGTNHKEFENAGCTKANANGPFGWNAITVAKLVDSTGELTLEDTSTPLGASAVKCKGVDHGTIGPGDKDLISSIVATSCVGVKICEAPIVAEPVNLPWGTLLETVGGKIRDKITSEISGAKIGWKVKCTAGIFGEQNDLCLSASTTTGMDNSINGSVADVTALFDASSSRASCSLGNSTSGVVTGFNLVEGLNRSGAPLGIRVK